MKNTLFLMTHLGSNWQKLAGILQESPYIQVYQTNQSYGHPDDVSYLRQNPHKQSGSVAKYVDVIFHNKDFSMKRLCEYYQFIFWSTPLNDCLDDIIKTYKYGRSQAEDYYHIRLEGMRQYHLRSPESLWNPVLNKESILNSIF